MGAALPQQPEYAALAGHGSSSRSGSFAADICAWSLNVGSAVAIVIVNKVLMSSTSGYGFSFGECAPRHVLYQNITA